MSRQSHRNIAIFIPHLGCKHQCSFCNQRVISGEEQPMSPEQAERIIAGAYAQITDPIQRKETEIAFFGGSFTAIGIPQMEAYLSVCTPYLGENGFAGIRISTRPDAISEPILELLARYGVTSIELGVQSLDDAVLQKNDRGHTAADCYQAIEKIKAYRFSLGLQMMVGLYGESKESLYHTASEILRLKPDTLRIYPVVVLKGTKLDALLQSGAYQPLSFEEAVTFCAEWMERFEAAGIRLIKVGLHASQEVSSQMTGGIYHPAFREICESRIYRRKIEAQLGALGEYSLYLPKAAVSKAVGQKRENLLYFEKQGYHLRLKPCDRNEILLERN